MVEEVTEGVVTDSGAAVGAENNTTILLILVLSQTFQISPAISVISVIVSLVSFPIALEAVTSIL